MSIDEDLELEEGMTQMVLDQGVALQAVINLLVEKGVLSEAELAAAVDQLIEDPEFEQTEQH
ncbi:MAG: nitrile hydratase subunit beta [Acidobacteria bacterium]|nr:nitrile hydratase subunit beta [Acidobacteriota bacterium]